jgi:hypothetical protein
MRKCLLFIYIFLLVVPSTLQAQHKGGKKRDAVKVLPEPRVWIRNISSYHTDRDAILANPVLITDSVGCKVSGFTVSLEAPDHDFYGPLHVNGDEMSDVQKAVIKEWDYKGVTVHIQDIHLNCHETDATSSPLKYYFDH